MCNIYIYSLAYLCWPVETYLKEYEIDESKIELGSEDVTKIEVAPQADVVSP